MGPPRKAPVKIADVFGGYLDSSGKEVMRFDDLVTYEFVKEDLGSVCKLSSSGSPVSCHTVDRKGNIGAQIPGYLENVLCKRGTKDLYLYKKPTRDEEEETKFGVLSSDFKVILDISEGYDQIFCLKGCRRLIVSTTDEITSDTGKSTRVRYALHHSGTGERIRWLSDWLHLKKEGGHEALNEVMRFPASIKVLPYHKGDFWGLVSLGGKVLVKATYDIIKIAGPTFLLGGSGCRSDDSRLNISQCTWEILDGTGKPTGKPFLSEVSFPPSEKQGHSHVVGRSRGTGNFGLWDSDGREIMRPVYDGILDLTSYGLIGFRTTPTSAPKGAGPLWGLADKTGKVLVPPRWHHLGRGKPDTDNNLLTIMVEDAAKVPRWGLIDRTGKVVVEPRWNEINFGASLLFVRKGSLWGVLDRKGKELIRPTFSTISREGVAKRPRGGTSFMDSSGRVILDGMESIKALNDRLLEVETGGKFRLYSATTGKPLVKEPVASVWERCFSRDENMKRGIFPVSLPGPDRNYEDRRYGLVGFKGPVTAFSYASLGCSAFGLSPFTRINSQKPAKAHAR